MTDWETARHEAGHAVMAITLGIPIRRVWVDPAIGGGVEYAPVFPQTRKGFLHRMMCVLAGPIESALTGDDLPQWPLNSDHDCSPLERQDCNVLHALARHLSMTEQDYRQLEICTLKITSTDAYQQLVGVISGVLDYRPVLDGGLIDRLVTAHDRRL